MKKLKVVIGTLSHNIGVFSKGAIFDAEDDIANDLLATAPTVVVEVKDEVRPETKEEGIKMNTVAVGIKPETDNIAKGVAPKGKPTPIKAPASNIKKEATVMMI